MTTLLLDRSTWDLVVDANGNIAVAQAPYALAQDAASAIKTFLGEVWYDTSIGIPYSSQIIGKSLPVSVFRQYMVDAALSVPGVVSASCTIQSVQARTVTGQVAFTDALEEESMIFAHFAERVKPGAVWQTLTTRVPDVPE